jgi:ubiquinone/menaquinone biosynthesis C-methylase UbiE
MLATTEVNHWLDARCAKAFWGQHNLPSFKRLVADTVEWAAPAPGERWLDLGCGGGALTRALWKSSSGQVGAVVGVDCAAINADCYARLSEELQAIPSDRVRFVCHNFSAGLDLFDDESFDHAVSGLSISYAECWDEVSGRWTRKAYHRVLEEVCRVLRPGGRFVFSVNVPEPNWSWVGLCSLGAMFSTAQPLRFLKQSWRMVGYGAWLKQEARTGRFHYLPHGEVVQLLHQAGFVHVKHRLSYSRQAYVFVAHKPR